MKKRMEKIKTTVTLDRRLWGMVKGIAIEHRTTASLMLERILREYFKVKEE